MEGMSRCLSRRELLAAALLFALLCLLTPTALGAYVLRMEPRDLAAVSPNVVVATVEGREVRWNEGRTLLVTDYRLRVEDRLRGDSPELITLTMPGGTLGDITDETCLTVALETGARYLLFLGDLERPSLSPIVGASQGAIRDAPMRLDGRPVRFDDFVAAVRRLVEETPLAPRKAAVADRSLPAKAWEPVRSLAAPFVFTQPAVPPIEINPLPPGPFSPADQEAMAYWNLYGGDLFRATSPVRQWAYGNGVFDLAGFPDDTQMEAQFKMKWEEFGSGILGVAFVRRQNGAVIEADVALNPGKAWTLDPAEATTRGPAYSFREVMTHELGHTWGLKHPFETQQAWWDSVMQYKSKVFYTGTIFADDAAAVRSAFPPGRAIRDGLVSSYVTSWDGVLAELATYRPAAPRSQSVKAGGTFSLNGPIKVENAGSVSLTGLKVEVFLVPRRFSMEDGIRIKTLRVPGALASGATKRLNVGKIRLPANVPSGTYFLAYHLSVPKDGYPANNDSWSNWDVTLTVK